MTRILFSISLISAVSFAHDSSDTTRKLALDAHTNAAINMRVALSVTGEKACSEAARTFLASYKEAMKPNHQRMDEIRLTLLKDFAAKKLQEKNGVIPISYPEDFNKGEFPAGGNFALYVDENTKELHSLGNKGSTKKHNLQVTLDLSTLSKSSMDHFKAVNNDGLLLETNTSISNVLSTSFGDDNQIYDDGISEAFYNALLQLHRRYQCFKEVFALEARYQSEKSRDATGGANFVNLDSPAEALISSFLPLTERTYNVGAYWTKERLK